VGSDFIVFSVKFTVRKVRVAGVSYHGFEGKNSEVEQNRIRVGRMVKRNPELSTNDVVKHFAKEGMPKPTAYRLIRRAREGQALERKPDKGENPP
jgi:hypothetical protein